MVKNIAIGTGRRKTAVARVFVRDGSGKIVINGKDGALRRFCGIPAFVVIHVETWRAASLQP